jgi:hypothetical protein
MSIVIGTFIVHGNKRVGKLCTGKNATPETRNSTGRDSGTRLTKLNLRSVRGLENTASGSLGGHHIVITETCTHRSTTRSSVQKKKKGGGALHKEAESGQIHGRDVCRAVGSQLPQCPRLNDVSMIDCVDQERKSCKTRIN